MSSFEFWRRWLIVVSWGLIVFGLGIAFFNQTPAFDLVFNDRIDPSFWRGGAIPPDASLFQRWIYGVVGAVVAGWAALMALVIRHAFASREPWVWRALALGVGLWFVIDTAISLLSGVSFNVLVNLLLLVALGAPLAATRKHFSR